MPLTKAFTQQLTVMGRVMKVLDDPNKRPGLLLRLRSEDEIEARLMPTSWISTVKNLDLLDRDRFPDVDSHLGQPRTDHAGPDEEGRSAPEPKTRGEQATSERKRPTESETKLKELRGESVSLHFSGNNVLTPIILSRV